MEMFSRKLLQDFVNKVHFWESQQKGEWSASKEDSICAICGRFNLLNLSLHLSIANSGSPCNDDFWRLTIYPADR